MSAEPKSLSRLILAWYDRHRRDLPWRAAPGTKPDPYSVWLSEIMLQQTTVATVIPYYHAFLARWPDVAALAAAELDDVLHAWQGLGYYARARNLHRCARMVASDLDGIFPGHETDLRRLPGIGAYTAAAIAAIAFDRAANVVDGNVERVMARLWGVETPLPAAKAELAVRAAELVPARRPGDYAQAVMDLGATICTPRSPACDLCPWRSACRALAGNLVDELPRRGAKRPRPVRRAVAFWIERADGAILLRRRPERGLLGGMMEIPSSPWRAAEIEEAEVAAAAPVRAKWRTVDGRVDHTFTHFHLILEIRRATAPAREAGKAEGVWVAPAALDRYALPTVMRKIVAHVQDADQNQMRPVRTLT